MSKLAFTVGQWELWEANDKTYIIDEGGDTIAVMGQACRLDEERANARLIAAAPELYEALKALVESPNAKQNAMRDAARAALAKVEGE